MSRLLFTGERLHEGDALFGVDVVRHRAAYAYAIEHAKSDRAVMVLDLGCGTGYGTALLADSLPRVFAVDRISPDPDARHGSAGFVRADLRGIPFDDARFDLVVSFQVIEHFADPTLYLDTIARIARTDGTALISTPNVLKSDGENPFHAHEYGAAELAARLGTHFEEVDVLGVGATPGPMAYYDARLRRIASIVRLDPLGLRFVLPRRVVDFLFSRLAVVVRSLIRRSEGLPAVTLADFPVGPATDDSLDLLAVCRRPRATNSPGAAP